MSGLQMRLTFAHWQYYAVAVGVCGPAENCHTSPGPLGGICHCPDCTKHPLPPLSHCHDTYDSDSEFGEQSEYAGDYSGQSGKSDTMDDKATQAPKRVFSALAYALGAAAVAGAVGAAIYHRKVSRAQWTTSS